MCRKNTPHHHHPKPRTYLMWHVIVCVAKWQKLKMSKVPIWDMNLDHYLGHNLDGYLGHDLDHYLGHNLDGYLGHDLDHYFGHNVDHYLGSMPQY